MRQDASSERTVTRSSSDAREASAIDAALASRAFWKDLCEAAGDLMFETDRAGRFVFLAPAKILGYDAHALIGHLSSDILCGWDRPAGAAVNPFAAASAIRMKHAWLRQRDGSAALFAISLRPTDGGGVRGIGIDVTSDDDMVRASVKAVLFQSTLDRIVARMRDEILTSRIVRAGLRELIACLGAEGAAVVPVSQPDARDGAPLRADAMSGPLHGAGDGWDEIAAQGMPDLDALSLQPSILSAGAGRHLLVCSNQTRFGPPSALVVWRRNEQPDWRDDERRLTLGVAAALRGVIEQDSMQREISDQSRTDVLTGLPSRRSFQEETRRRFDRLDRDAEPGTLMSVDLDDFGGFNETHGAERGDDALAHVAAVLRDLVRPTDLVCRIAGDHFAIWLDGADGFAAAERAEWLCRNGITGNFDGLPYRLGASVGLASRPARSLEDLDSLSRRADSAMMHAKRCGKGVWRASQQEIGI